MKKYITIAGAALVAAVVLFGTLYLVQQQYNEYKTMKDNENAQAANRQASIDATAHAAAEAQATTQALQVERVQLVAECQKGAALYDSLPKWIQASYARPSCPTN